MARGGMRVNAGRKSNATKKVEDYLTKNKLDPVSVINKLEELNSSIEQGRVDLVQYVLKEQTGIVKGMIDLAKGVRLLRVDEEGKESIYRKAPDIKAATWLMEFVHGKAAQQIQVQTDTKITIVSNVPRPVFAIEEVIEVTEIDNGSKALNDGQQGLLASTDAGEVPQ